MSVVDIHIKELTNNLCNLKPGCKDFLETLSKITTLSQEREWRVISEQKWKDIPMLESREIMLKKAEELVDFLKNPVVKKQEPVQEPIIIKKKNSPKKPVEHVEQDDDDYILDYCSCIDEKEEKKPSPKISPLSDVDNQSNRFRNDIIRNLINTPGMFRNLITDKDMSRKHPMYDNVRMENNILKDPSKHFNKIFNVENKTAVKAKITSIVALIDKYFPDGFDEDLDEEEANRLMKDTLSDSDYECLGNYCVKSFSLGNLLLCCRK